MIQDKKKTGVINFYSILDDLGNIVGSTECGMCFNE